MSDEGNAHLDKRCADCIHCIRHDLNGHYICTKIRKRIWWIHNEYCTTYYQRAEQ